jgi:glutamine amidotransferase
MIAVVTYGVSNVGSMFNMLQRIGVPATAASTPAEIEKADKIILPGVGAFDHGMSTLVERGLAEPLKKRVLQDRVPILGVCLGMQLLGRGSEEGVLGGLGLVDGRSVRLHSNGEGPLKVPHMGWSVVAPSRESPLFNDLDARARFYFVHSYHLVCADSTDVLATARYGVEFTAMVHRDNVWGAQFHPEKSHRYGMTLLRNFASL